LCFGEDVVGDDETGGCPLCDGVGDGKREEDDVGKSVGFTPGEKAGETVGTKLKKSCGGEGKEDGFRESDGSALGWDVGETGEDIGKSVGFFDGEKALDQSCDGFTLGEGVGEDVGSSDGSALG